MTLHLIRHALAGDRAGWAAADFERPLDQRGRHQANRLATLLADRPPNRLISSPAIRCTQTLAPMAAAHGLDVEIHAALAEGTRPTDTTELLRDLADADTDVALCSHGDVIPPTLSLLMREGMVVIGRRGCDKGSVWELEVRGRDIVSARYRPEATLDLDLTLSRDLAST